MTASTRSYTLGQLAEMVDGCLTGDPDILITGASTIRLAGETEITLADKPELARKLQSSSAAAVVVSYSFVPDDKPTICVDNVHAAFTKIVNELTPQRTFTTNTIHPSAIIDETAAIGSQVTIHARAVIGADVTIEDNCVIHPGVVIMDGTTIGANTTIFPNATLYEETIVGKRCIIHAGAVLGAFGFGYDSSSGEHKLSAQLGNVVLEDDVEIGASSTIDRGTYGPTRIGQGTKIDNLVMIGHNCELGQHNLICSLTGIAGSCTIGDYVVMAGQVGIADHVEIGNQITFAAKAGIMADVLEKGVYAGLPTAPIREKLRQWSALRKMPTLLKEIKSLQRQVDSFVAQEQQTTEAETKSKNSAA